MKNKIQHSYKNLKSAHSELVHYLTLPIETPRDRAGIIKAFEFTFELAWKTFYKMAKAEKNDNIIGPKSSLGWALKAGIISQEEESLWFSMLEDRNLTSHTYRNHLSQEIAKRIQNNYNEAFDKVLQRLAKLCD